MTRQCCKYKDRQPGLPVTRKGKARCGLLWKISCFVCAHSKDSNIFVSWLLTPEILIRPEYCLQECFSKNSALVNASVVWGKWLLDRISFILQLSKNIKTFVLCSCSHLNFWKSQTKWSHRFTFYACLQCQSINWFVILKPFANLILSKIKMTTNKLPLTFCMLVANHKLHVNVTEHLILQTGAC